LWCDPTAQDLRTDGYTPNARLAPSGRERLIRQRLDERRTLAELAIEHGISDRTARNWLARFSSGWTSALADRQSVRRT